MRNEQGSKQKEIDRIVSTSKLQACEQEKEKRKNEQ
jgi:hypothetical protein